MLGRVKVNKLIMVSNSRYYVIYSGNRVFKRNQNELTRFSRNSALIKEEYMSIEIKVPTVGESISEVTLVKWLKAEGEWAERDEVIAELGKRKSYF